jgi:hypothetical protein
MWNGSIWKLPADCGRMTGTWEAISLAWKVGESETNALPIPARTRLKFHSPALLYTIEWETYTETEDIPA